jgi:hypothetical protein
MHVCDQIWGNNNQFRKGGKSILFSHQRSKWCCELKHAEPLTSDVIAISSLFREQHDSIVIGLVKLGVNDLIQDELIQTSPRGLVVSMLT